MDVIIVIAAGIVGIVVGTFISKWVLSRKSSGALRVDTSDPDDGPYMFLEIKDQVEVYKIMRKEYVTLRVKFENFISQK